MCGVRAVMEGQRRVTVIQLHSPFLIDLWDFCDALLFLYRCLTIQTDAGRHSVLCTLSSVSNRAMTGAASCGPARRCPPTYFDLRHPVAGGCDIIGTLCLPFTLFFFALFSAACLSFPLLHHLHPSFLDFRVLSPPLTPVWKHSPAPQPRPSSWVGRRTDGPSVWG